MTRVASGTTTLNRYGFNKMISLAVSGGIDIILDKRGQPLCKKHCRHP